MRRYFIYAGLTAVIGGFLISPPSARADFTLVQRATSTVGNVSTGVTSTLPSTPTAGNLLIVAISAYNGSTSTAAFTVADKAGNTWHLATTTCGGAPCSATTNVFSSLFYAYNITSTSSETIHVSSSINPTFLTIGVYEFSGALSATDPFDKVVSAANATASSTSGNLTTTSSPELFFSNISPWTAGTTVTAGNGFSIVDSIPTVAGTTQGLNTEAKSAGATTTASPLFPFFPPALSSACLILFVVKTPKINGILYSIFNCVIPCVTAWHM